MAIINSTLINGRVNSKYRHISWILLASSCRQYNISKSKECCTLIPRCITRECARCLHSTWRNLGSQRSVECACICACWYVSSHFAKTDLSVVRMGSVASTTWQPVTQKPTTWLYTSDTAVYPLKSSQSQVAQKRTSSTCCQEDPPLTYKQ